MVKQHLRLSRTRQRFRDARCAFAVWHMQALLEIPSYYRTDAFRTLDVYERWAPTRNLTRTNIQIGGVKPLSFFEKLSISRVIEESYELSYFRDKRWRKSLSCVCSIEMSARREYICF